ncbi:hypothetical protein HXA34_20070 [Salipaludibacillus agaradhaerens]|jgi:hypothetical protein|uniref:hypothetical protein n=1 Tax=Salipaludibacillus agaradhaerens TaxID=76935 RepID=UPI0021507234|nr:hypothetical protein [Salipaludibacillus agaradhaerens]MCR6108588.1 hypothetical protein [Salipaludibacillus agaradhaerens]MCR6120617.1 hypothetical protein [Salipaludibacillus agaradhaerens]
MNHSKRTFIKLSRRDIGLILGIGVLGAILNVYPYPFVAAGAVSIGILLLRISETPESQTHDVSAHDDQRSIEKRSAEEIIASKLNEGLIEKTIDARFDTMVADIVDDLFGNYGDMSRQIKDKLKETMNPYIEKYDFNAHSVKLEHLLNQLVTSVTKHQDTILLNLRDMMATDPISEISTSQLFEKYTTHISENVDTDNLDIDFGDTPTYQNLTAELRCEDERSYSSRWERKSLTFTCEEDESMNVRVDIVRSTTLSTSSKVWRIESIERINRDESDTIQLVKRNKDLTDLESPIIHLRHLSELEIYFLKLYYDRATIILDEVDLCDEDVEVKAEPEMSFS